MGEINIGTTSGVMAGSAATRQSKGRRAPYDLVDFFASLAKTGPNQDVLTTI